MRGCGRGAEEEADAWGCRAKPGRRGAEQGLVSSDTRLRHSHPMGPEQSSQALISLQTVLRRPPLLCAGGAEVSKVSGGGHVGAPVTHTTSLERRPFWDGSVPSPAWVTFAGSPKGGGLAPGDPPGGVRAGSRAWPQERDGNRV